MPYRLSENHSGCPAEKPWGVVNSTTGELRGCSPTRAKAVDHMRALYANVPDARVAGATELLNADGETIGWVTGLNAVASATDGTANVTDVSFTSLPGVRPILASAAAPLAPPKEWFDAEEPSGPEPLTVEPDGRVHGHLALWDACHVGILNGQMAECVRPPRSQNNYQSFHLGQLITEDGSPVSVGKIVYDGSHAALTADLVGATRHYDKTGRVAAFVKARDGRHGIYLTGATRSNLSPEGLRDLRVNPPSGDWRNLRGRLEMIAALAVPVPGYQTPQVAITASGAVEALILPGFCEECLFDEEESEVIERGSRAFLRKRSVIASVFQIEDVEEPLQRSDRAFIRQRSMISETLRGA